LNPWWLRPTAEGASENPREADDAGGGEAGRDDAAGEKSGSEKKSGSKTTAASKKTASTKTGGDRPADPAPAASPRARSRGGRSRQPKGGAEKAPAAAEAAGVKKNGKTDEPAVASPAAERSRRRPRGRGDDEPDAPPDLTFDDDITSADFAELRRELDSPPERNRPVSDELKIAMFCDLENIAIGVRDSAIKKFDINLILERLLEKGKIIVKKAYCDWERYNDYKRPFHEAAIEMIEIPQKHYSGKNSADIKMVVDAMDLSYSKEHLDTFVIVSGDSDFSPLVSKLKENDKTSSGWASRTPARRCSSTTATSSSTTRTSGATARAAPTARGPGQEGERGLPPDGRRHAGAGPREQGRALGLDDQADDAAQEALLQRGLLRLLDLLRAARGRRAQQPDQAEEGPALGDLHRHRLLGTRRALTG
jgi:hypothetical protein